MAKKRHRSVLSGNDRKAWRVLDDFPDVVPVTPAELDAIEAFLMPVVNAIMAGTSAAEGPGVKSTGLRPTDPEVSKGPAPIAESV